jgi:hypothetical protein
MTQRSTVFIAAGFLLILSVSCPSISPGVAAPKDEFDIPEVVKAVKEEVQRARARDTGSPKLRIDRVELELRVAAKQELTTGVTVSVVAVKGAASEEKTHTLSIVLTPIGDVPVGTGNDLGLVPAIQSIKQTLRKSINTPPAFGMRTFIFEVETAIEKNVAGSINFIVIKPELERKNVITHKIKFHMSVP